MLSKSAEEETNTMIIGEGKKNGTNMCEKYIPFRNTRQV